MSVKIFQMSSLQIYGHTGSVLSAHVVLVFKEGLRHLSSVGGEKGAAARKIVKN